MKKTAKAAQPKKASGLKKAIAVAAIVTAVQCNTPEPLAFIPPVKTYEGDNWEKMYAIPYTKNGKPDYLAAIQPTGDMLADVGHFLFGQGGGKSCDLEDSITKNPNCWPPVADADGVKYHTVNDITWVLFSDPKMSKQIGYTPTADDFYNMTKERHDSIVNWHLEAGKVTKSDICNLVLSLCIWGGGGYFGTLRAFEAQYGNVNTFIDLKGEYFVFYRLLSIRREQMKLRNPNDWKKFGTGWSSGLAHFHRIFKVYAKN